MARIVCLYRPTIIKWIMIRRWKIEDRIEMNKHGKKNTAYIVETCIESVWNGKQPVNSTEIAIRFYILRWVLFCIHHHRKIFDTQPLLPLGQCVVSEERASTQWSNVSKVPSNEAIHTTRTTNNNHHNNNKNWWLAFRANIARTVASSHKFGAIRRTTPDKNYCFSQFIVAFLIGAARTKSTLNVNAWTAMRSVNGKYSFNLVTNLHNYYCYYYCRPDRRHSRCRHHHHRLTNYKANVIFPRGISPKYFRQLIRPVQYTCLHLY